MILLETKEADIPLDGIMMGILRLLTSACGDSKDREPNRMAAARLVAKQDNRLRCCSGRNDRDMFLLVPAVKATALGEANRLLLVVRPT